MKPQDMFRFLAGVLPLLAFLLAAPDAARSQASVSSPLELAPGAHARLAQAAGDSRFAPWQRDRALRMGRTGNAATPGSSAADLRRALPAHVADSASGSQVDPNMWVTNGTVDAIATSGSTIYIGGDFTRVSPRTGSFVGIDAGSGAPVANRLQVAGTVLCSAPDGVGGWFIGGEFTSVAGQYRGNLAHIHGDMTLDAWDPWAGGSVYSLAVNGTMVYAGGNFAFIGGQNRSCIAALDASTGLATPWNPSAGSDPNDGPCVYALAVSGSTVYVGGFFTSIGGQSRTGIAALDASTGLATPWSPTSDDWVACLAVSGSTVYVGGFFMSIGGQNRSNIAALDAGTGLATPWNPEADNTVWSLAVNGATVYAGGYFDDVGGQSRSRIAALDASTGLATPWNPAANGEVRSLAVSGTTVYAGGGFTGIGGLSRSSLAALDASTGLATPWNPSAGGDYYNGFPYVYSLAVSGTTVYAGGHFTSIGGQSRNHIAALDAGTGLATPWNPGADNPVYALAVSGSTVYAGGDFTSIGGQSRRCIAALDGSTGLANSWNPSAGGTSPLVQTLGVSGTTVYAGGQFTGIGGQSRNGIAALDASTGLATLWNPSAGGSSPDVYSLVVSGTTVYAGGYFTSIGGQSRSNIAALDTGTGLATPWNPRAERGIVSSLAISGTIVYAGGYLTSIGGQSRSNIAALDANTGLATPWNPGADNYVRTVAVSGTTVYAGGDFTNIGGHSRNRIAALDASTGLATSWNPGADSSVYSLAVSGSTVYVGGDFNSIGGQTASYFAAIGPADNTAPIVHVLSPGGGETLVNGTTRALAWSATDDVGVQSVDLYLSRTGTSGPWELLAAGAANTGTYNWLVSGAAANNSAYLRVDARDFGGNIGTGMSAAAFTTPTLVELFRAVPTDAGVRVEWDLSDPSAVQSLALEHAALASGGWEPVAATPVVSGSTTSVLDAIAAGQEQWYRLSGVQRDGRSFTFGPISVTAQEAITAFALSPLSPNPMRCNSLLTFAIPTSTHVHLSLLDVQGREVALLADGMREPGRYTAALQASDLRAGIYFVRMQAGRTKLTRRVVVIK